MPDSTASNEEKKVMKLKYINYKFEFRHRQSEYNISQLNCSKKHGVIGKFIFDGCKSKVAPQIIKCAALPMATWII